MHLLPLGGADSIAWSFGIDTFSIGGAGLCCLGTVSGDDSLFSGVSGLGSTSPKVTVLPLNCGRLLPAI